MKRRHSGRVRRRRRRWSDRALRRLRRAWTPPLAGTEGVPRATLVLGDLEFVAADGELRVAAIDYHAAPVHLGETELTELGLALSGGNEGGWPVSVAEPWAASLDGRADRRSRGPALADPAWALPPGRRVGGLHFARVRGGLDVFVIDYHAGEARLAVTDLAGLGLRRRSSAPAPSRRGSA